MQEKCFVGAARLVGHPTQYPRIGGWLILPAIGLVLTPVVRGLEFLMGVAAIGNATEWAKGLASFEILANLVQDRDHAAGPDSTPSSRWASAEVSVPAASARSAVSRASAR